jgi:ABC-type nitrate/sulfonate/bicarbonate transport system permease component
MCHISLSVISLEIYISLKTLIDFWSILRFLYLQKRSQWNAFILPSPEQVSKQLYPCFKRLKVALCLDYRATGFDTVLLYYIKYNTFSVSVHSADQFID